MSEITPDSVQIARLEERMSTLARDLEMQTNALDEVRKQLDEVLKALHEAKGGWRLMMLLGGGAASLGGIATWALSHVTIK